MERELEELAVRAAVVFSAALGSETEVGAEVRGAFHKWFDAVSPHRRVGLVTFHVTSTGSVETCARHIRRYLAQAKDTASAAALLHDLTDRYESYADFTPQASLGTPSADLPHELTDRHAGLTPQAGPGTPEGSAAFGTLTVDWRTISDALRNPGRNTAPDAQPNPASPDRTDRVATLTSMLVGAKLEQPPPAAQHEPPPEPKDTSQAAPPRNGHSPAHTPEREASLTPPGQEDAPRAEHPRNGHHSAQAPEPDDVPRADAPWNGRRTARTPEREASLTPPGNASASLGPGDALRADHPRSGPHSAQTPEPGDTPRTDHPRNSHHPTQLPNPEAPPSTHLPATSPFSLPAPASPHTRPQEHAPSAPTDAHPTPPQQYDPPSLAPEDAAHPDPTPTPSAPDLPPASATPPRDHVDFSRGTFHGPVTGAVGGNVYFNHPTPTHPDPTTWPTLADLTDAEALGHGVREARRVEDGAELPLYVVRDVETGRDWFGGGGLLVLTGRKLAGKTRTAWEALFELPPDTRVFAPSPGTDLRALPALLADHPGRHVLWLDDLDAHLSERHLDIKLLTELTRARVQIVGTMNDDVYDAYVNDTDSPAHRVLVRATKERLSTAWSDTELARARNSEDPRLTEALEWRGDTGVTQYLAVAPLLADTWRRMLVARSRRDPREYLLLASVDLARCGVRGGLTRDLLARAQTACYGHTAAVDEALAWASERRYGVTGLLVPGNRKDTWRPHGALVAAALREDRPIPVGIWREALADTSYDAEDRHTVHINARTHFTPRAAKGDLDAMHMLGLLKEAEGDPNGAMHWFRKAADAGCHEVAERVGAYLLSKNHPDQALPYLRQATDHAPTPTAHRLLAEAHLTLAEQALHKAAEANDRHAAGQLGDLELRLGDASRAAQYYLRKDQPTPLARNLAAYHVLRGEPETAQPYLERAAHDGDDRAVRILDDLRAGPQTLQDAESYFRGSTDPQDLAHLGVVLERSGRSTEALQTYDEAAAQGDAFAQARAEALRRERDTVDE
ncbi:tetratricopeptide repeat protein [Streptomyces acidiscabies]|uniref:tetratricopeptide repeat protein n=1 Tax=Streptomyces acidiscabies TaxID=42234 RepID=UPI000A48613C|nr:hypothetical protein [Streptomyces acidiscabies]